MIKWPEGDGWSLLNQSGHLASPFLTWFGSATGTTMPTFRVTNQIVGNRPFVHSLQAY